MMNGLLHGIIFIIIFPPLIRRRRRRRLPRSTGEILHNLAVHARYDRQRVTILRRRGKQNRKPWNHVNLDGRQITTAPRGPIGIAFSTLFVQRARDNERVTRLHHHSRRRGSICNRPMMEKRESRFPFRSFVRIIMIPS